MTARRSSTNLPDEPNTDPDVDQGDDDQADGKTAAKTEAAPSYSVGDVIKNGDSYGLVVGFENVTHINLQNDGSTEKVKTDHPLVVDLGVARRVENEISPAS